MRKSVLIIGGGLGGLFSGAILSKEGLEVTVLEKNAVIGGGLQTFRRFGTEFDTGMHIIGGLQQGGSIRRLCEWLGIWDKIRVKDTDRDCSDGIFFAEDGKTYRIAKGRSGLIASLTKEFPLQEENLKAYVDALYRLTDEVTLFRLKPEPEEQPAHSEEFNLSASAFIAKYISDKRLRSVLAWLNPLYGGRADFTPAYVHALISVLYMEGSCRFEGGSLHFAEILREVIVSHGGKVLASEEVVAVHSKGKAISGVSTRSGKRFTADTYICAIHPCTFLGLMDEPAILPKAYRERLNDLPNAYSAFTLNIKFKKGRFPYCNHTLFYVSRYDRMWDLGRTEGWPDGFLFITPPENGQGAFADKAIVTVPMDWEEVRRWENTTSGKRGEDYKRWKAERTEQVLERLQRIFPDIRDCIEALDAASPLTIRDYYGVKEGSMFGFAKDCNNPLLSRVPVVTKVPNLLLTGQNCNLHGFCGVCLTAVGTCEAILGKNYLLHQLSRFDDIRPYYPSEIHDAMSRLAARPEMDQVLGFLFPEKHSVVIKEQLRKIDSSEAFQKQIMYPAIGKILENSSEGFCCEGLEKLVSGRSYLFVSNHRDIMLDAALLCYALVSRGLDTPEITFGANLMQGDFVIDVGKVNKMFRVERPGEDLRAFYRQSEHLSDYIRTTLLQRGQSVWIVQRNGRTKDGEDRTDPGVLKMFAMSAPSDDNRVKSLDDLHIVPLSISYEWEPCDLLKAVELQKRAEGPYWKAPGEDLGSILTGILQPKGRICLHICDPLTQADLTPLSDLPSKQFFNQAAALLDERICSAYRLFPGNYIAHDLLGGKTEYAAFYSGGERDAFEEYLRTSLDRIPENERESIRTRLLGIYARPVDSHLRFAAR